MGLFIAFEGIEGSGKSTQSRELKRRLTQAGYPTTLAREPGGTPAAERVRRLLKGANELSPLVELFLFSAARSSLVDSVIRSALERGEVVVCDRYIHSTLAYQGYGRGLQKDMIRRMNEIATGGLLPQLVVLLDLGPTQGFKRISGRPLDRIEQEQHHFHQRVRDGYLELARQDPERWFVLDSSQSRASLADSIWQRTSQMLERGQAPT